LEEVVGEGGLVLAPLPQLIQTGGANVGALDLQFGFDDIGAIPSQGLTPSSAIHFSAITGVVGVNDGLASFSGDDSDVSSTPSSPPPLSPVFKTEMVQPTTSSIGQQQPILHYSHMGYPSPGSESFSSASSSPDHSYDLDPVPGVVPLTGGMMSLPIAMPHSMAPSQNGVTVPPSSSSVSSASSTRSTKRRRAVNGVESTGSGSDDSTSKSRVSWIPASEAKLDGGDDDDEDDDDDSTDGKKGTRRGKGAANGNGVGKQSKRERNKISASKYRKRRKQYLDGLEGQCNELKSQLNSQTKKINSLTTENKVYHSYVISYHI
jgi:hypothetical protein